MKIILPSFELMDTIEPEKIIHTIETAGRVCYKSEHHMAQGSGEKLIKNLIKSGHESVLEHEKITVKIICDRGVSHEIVRHRLASYSQESTRYCNYAHEKFNNELTFIKPSFFAVDSKNYELWAETCQIIEKNYMELLENGAKPEEARSILPNSLKTEIVMTLNIRAWRHFFSLRCPRSAHPQIREIALMILASFNELLPVFFDDMATLFL